MQLRTFENKSFNLRIEIVVHYSLKYPKFQEKNTLLKFIFISVKSQSSEIGCWENMLLNTNAGRNMTWGEDASDTCGLTLPFRNKAIAENEF